jgi:hypothetical protein
MKLKVISLCVGLLLLIPLADMNFANADDENEQATVEVFDSFGNKLSERTVDARELADLERDVMEGDLDFLGINWDFGFSNYIISYGKGKVYIPLSNERTFFRLLLRPIFFNYYDGGFTLVKFGANHVWKGKTIGDYGFMLMEQWGMMWGFFGLHAKISWKMRPETHIFVGGSLLVGGYDRLL